MEAAPSSVPDEVQDKPMDSDQQSGDGASAAAFDAAMAPVTIDSAALREVQRKVEEWREKAEQHLSELVAERERSNSSYEEVQCANAKLATAMEERLQAQKELGNANLEIVRVQEEKDKVQRSKDEAEKMIGELRGEVKTHIDEKAALFREKAEQIRKLQNDLEVARGEVQFHRDVAEAAREMQNTQRASAEEAQQELKKKSQSFAEEKAALEKKLELRAGQLKKEEEFRETAQNRQEEVLATLNAAVAAKNSVEEELEQRKRSEAELQKRLSTLEAERSATKDEINEARKQRDEALEVVANAPKVVDSPEFKAAQQKIDEWKKVAEERLTELVAERERSLQSSQKLKLVTSDLAAVSVAKLTLEQELTIATSELQPVRQDRDRLKQEKAEAEKLIESLKDELQERTDERNRIFQEKADSVRKLRGELEAVRGELQFQSDVAEEARGIQKKARGEAADAQQELRKKTQGFLEEKAALERKLDLRADQLKQADELRQTAQNLHEEAIANLNDSLAAHDATQKELEESQEREAQLQRSLVKNEELLRRLLPGEDVEKPLPDGFSSLADMMHEIESSRKALQQLREDKQQLQDVLAEVEREVRAKYPALVQQREELNRLQTASELLTRQNERLLMQVRSLEAGKKDAELSAQQAKRSTEILESHARDMAKQLASVVHENKRLLGAGKRGQQQPQGTGGIGVAAATKEGETIRHVEDLAEQNEALRKTIALLRRDCETKAQKELVSLRTEFEKQTKELEQFSAEKNEQIKLLVAGIERLTKERNEAHQVLQAARQKGSATAAAEASSATSAAAVGAGAASAPANLKRKRLA